MSPVEEFRGSWIATSFNIDWPSKSGLSMDNQKQEYKNIIDKLKAVGMNSVILQIKPMGDAFYPSNYAPWSKYISGTLGINPGYDPLSFALDYVHQNNMEFHAWFNPFRISTDASFNKNNYINMLPTGSSLKSHPEWIVIYEGSYWLNLARPEVRNYVIDTIIEVVINYDIDGVQLDDYFYPYPKNNVDFPDQQEFKIYGSGYNSKADWRRDNVNKFILELSSKIRSVKFDIKFGVSPFGIWKNGISNGGADTNGLSSYFDLYCDSIKWIAMEWIDYIIPQIYWNIGYESAAYEKLLQWWATKVIGKDVHLYIGQAAYKVGNGSTYGAAWNNAQEIPNQINLNRNYTSVKGSSFFSTKDILANPLGLMNKLSTNLYSQEANIPYMLWKQISPFTVKYQAYIQNIGIQNEVSNWMIAGTMDQSLRLENIKIKLENAPVGLSVKYKAYVQNIGWQSFVYNGAMAGTQGQSLRLEALQIMLEGTDADKYSVEYQAYIQNIGWQNHVLDGAVAGTTGQSKRIEAIRIRIVERKVSVVYQGYVQKIGWQNWVKDGEVSGTQGQSLRLEGIRIKLENSPIGLNIKYRAHVQSIGWQSFVYNGALAGTQGKGLRLEALQIMLQGTDADKFSVEYQAHVQDIGWQIWMKDGDVAGTTGQSKRIEAIRIKIARK